MMFDGVLTGSGDGLLEGHRFWLHRCWVSG